MRPRAIIGALTVAAVSLAVGWGAAPAQAATSCIWGGTPAEPTGTFTISPGIKSTPAPGPLKLKATGPAEGSSCQSTVTFEGEVEAGSTCAVLIFDGMVKGVQGVQRFWGPGTAPMTQELLYDKAGNVVGFNNPSATNQGLAEQILADPVSCASREGFTHGSFSSIITLEGD